MSKQLVEAMGRAYQEIQEAKEKQKENNYIYAAKMAKKNGDKTFTIGGKEYDVDEALQKEDNTNDKSDDGDGLDKVQPKAVKKKFVDRKDKDIDNDGDVDSSDEYLHKRRKAVSKSLDEDDEEENGNDDDNGNDDNGDEEDKKKKKKKNGEKDDVEMNPKMEAKASDYKEVAVMKGKGGTQVKVVKDKQGNHVALFSGKGSTQVPIKKMDKKVLQKALDSFSKNGMIGNTLSSIEEKASIRMRLTSFLNEKAHQNPNAAKAEKPEDALKGKGAKDMMEPTKNPEVDDTEEKGHDDASKAGKVTKAAGGRNSGDAVRSGDQGVRNPLKKTMEAYASMVEKKSLNEQKYGVTDIKTATDGKFDTLEKFHTHMMKQHGVHAAQHAKEGGDHKLASGAHKLAANEHKKALALTKKDGDGPKYQKQSLIAHDATATAMEETDDVDFKKVKNPKNLSNLETMDDFKS